MDIFSIFSQLLLYIVLIVNIVLAVVIYRDNRQSATNIIFFFLCLTTSLWLLAIHKSTTPTTPFLTLVYTRLTVFLAVPQSVLFFLLAHTLPSINLLLKKSYFNMLLIGATLIMLLTVSPFVFKEVQITGGSIRSIPGLGMPFFAIFTSLVSLAAIYTLIKKIKSSALQVKRQLVLMMWGIVLMLGLIITTVMIPVILFQNQVFIPLTPAYALIFFGITAYAIVKHKLFNVKVIATEAFTVLLWIMLFSKLVVDSTLTERISDLFILIATIIFGSLLMQTVRKEVEQRERLEILDKELRGANEQLKSLDQARAEFITIASHQLRTPPTTIKWFLASILAGDHGKIPEEQKNILEKTNRANNSQISLIDDLLNVSRIERGKMEFLFQPCDLLELANTTFEQLQPIAKEKGLNLIFNQPKKKLPFIMADKEKIRQVMNNLIDNALKYTKRGSITVQLSATLAEIKFSVTDTGKGISSKEQNEIFEKYKRGNESVKQSAGLGLGLYVAKVIIGQHKGKIWAESQGEEKGSSFIFTLPIKSGLKETTLVDLAKNQG